MDFASRFDRVARLCDLEPGFGPAKRPPAERATVELSPAHTQSIQGCVATLVNEHPVWSQGRPADVVLSMLSPSHVKAVERRHRLRQLQMKARSQLLDDLKDSYAHCPEMQRKMAVEQLQIKLAPLQSKVREDVWKARSLSLPVRSELRRACSSSDQSRLSEKLYNRLQVDKSEMKRIQHREHMKEVLNHQVQFREAQAAQRKERQRLVKAISTHHKDRERQKLREQDKLRRERLKALRDNDEEAYLKLIQNTKNDRITQLLSQTEEYLALLGAKVASERERVEKFKSNEEIAADREAAARAAAEAKEAPPEEEQGPNNAGYIKEKKKYMAFAHRIQEKVKQPNCMVGGELKPYQLEGLEWLVSLYNNGLNGILADEMGLGKTIQTLALLTYLFEVKRNRGPYLIVVPLSTLSNWELEFAKWAPELVAVAYRGSKEQLKRLERTRLSDPSVYNCILTTYEMVMRSSFLKKTQLQYVIVDEGHRLKNADCKLFRTLTSFSTRHRLLLTGTPLQNSLDELWALLNFLLPSIFSSCDTFSEWFNSPFEEQGAAATGDRMEMEEEEMLLVINRLHQVLRPFVLRREKREVELQLPSKTEHVLRCDTSAWQKIVYEQLQNQALRSFDPSSGKIKASLMNNTVVQLRKCCNHPFLVNDEYEYNADELLRTSGKFDLLDRMLPKLLNTGHKVLIFSQMTKLLDLLEELLGMRDIDFLRLDGSTKPEDRAKVVRDFNHPDSETHIFLLSTRAGGLGLNLQVADTVILYDSDWNPQQDLQAQDRAHRIGQKSDVRVFRFVTATRMEENMYARAMKKLDMDAKIIQAGKFNNNASDEDRQTLLTSLLQGGGEARARAIPSYEQLNRLICRSEEEFEQFQKWDEDDQKEREKRWKADGNETPCPPRLMTDSELPDWLTLIPEEPEENDGRPIELGKRKRNAVTYDDGLTDKAFDKLIESDMVGNDTPLNAEGLKTLELERKKERKEERRGKKKQKKEKRHSEEKSANAPASEPPEWYGHVVTIFNAVYEAEDMSERKVRKWFEKLPPKEEEPHYYQVIKNPMDLKHVNKKIRRQLYTDPLHFVEDMRLMCSNAMQYNLEDSEIFEDALVIQSVLEEKVNDLMPQCKKADDVVDA